MLFNYVLGVYCHICRKYLDPHTEVFLDVLYEGSLTCDCGNIVGNKRDRQWQEYWGIK
jgi:hypothetical protein